MRLDAEELGRVVAGAAEGINGLGLSCRRASMDIEAWGPSTGDRGYDLEGHSPRRTVGNDPLLVADACAVDGVDDGEVSVGDRPHTVIGEIVSDVVAAVAQQVEMP